MGHRSAGTIRVAIVDDHPLVRSGTASELDRHPDIAVVGATGEGRAVLSLVERLQPDVLLLDIHLPDLSGIEVARLVRARYPRVAILVVTGYDDVGYARALLRFGVLGVMNKSATAEELVAAVRAVASGQPVLGPEIVGVGRDETPALTPRERDVLALLIAAKRNSEIAAALGVSINTIEFHIGRLYGKLGVRSRMEAVAKAREFGLLTSWPEPPT